MSVTNLRNGMPLVTVEGAQPEHQIKVMSAAFPLPPDLPEPIDDGACRHLPGMRVPSVVLPSTAGHMVNIGALTAPRTVIYCYPMTGVPDKALPAGWDEIPGARGCTTQTCGFRDHHAELTSLGAEVFGLSTQTTDYQRESDSPKRPSVFHKQLPRSGCAADRRYSVSFWERANFDQRRNGVVAFSFGQHRPSNASQLVRHCHNDHVACTSVVQSIHPFAQ